MKIGIRLHDTIPGSLEERLSYVKAQGYECGHLALSKVLPGFSMKDAPALLAQPGFVESVREPFRRLSYAGMACVKTYMGLGLEGYAQGPEAAQADYIPAFDLSGV